MQTGVPRTSVRRLSDISDLPAWAPDYARNVWEQARLGDPKTSENEARALAELDH